MISPAIHIISAPEDPKIDPSSSILSGPVDLDPKEAGRLCSDAERPSRGGAWTLWPLWLLCPWLGNAPPGLLVRWDQELVVAM